MSDGSRLSALRVATKGEGMGGVLDMSTLQGLRALGEQTGSPELLSELVEMFLADVPTRVRGLRAALEKGDATQGRAVAHALKGSAGQLGALQLASVAETIEHECAAGQVDAARGRLGAIDASFVEAKAAFDELLRAG